MTREYIIWFTCTRFIVSRNVTPSYKWEWNGRSWDSVNLYFVFNGVSFSLSFLWGLIFLPGYKLVYTNLKKFVITPLNVRILRIQTPTPISILFYVLFLRHRERYFSQVLYFGLIRDVFIISFKKGRVHELWFDCSLTSLIYWKFIIVPSSPVFHGFFC